MFGGFPQFVLPGKMIRENRISHPDWVKICVYPNGRIKLCTKQKYEILSATLLTAKRNMLYQLFRTTYINVLKRLTALLILSYDPYESVVRISYNPSSYGIGACILHKIPDGPHKPVAHASRTLLPAEKNYSQIEKESLGIVFAVEKFHRYIYGRHVTLQTYHVPF